jgi:hypothetical protein
MTTSNIKKFRLRFRDKPSSDQAAVRDCKNDLAGNPVEDDDWEHVASYSGKHHHVESDDEGYHVYRRKFRVATTDDRISDGWDETSELFKKLPPEIQEQLRKQRTEDRTKPIVARKIRNPADINAANKAMWERK